MLSLGAGGRAGGGASRPIIRSLSAPWFCIVSGFFVTAKGRLFIPLEKRGEYVDVLLNHHARDAIEGKELRSLTITSISLSICYTSEVGTTSVQVVYGVDRNEQNLTFGNRDRVVQVDMSKTTKIRQSTRVRSC